MNNILLVWELIPEESKIFRLLNLDLMTYRRIWKCHGHIAGISRECPPDVEETIGWLCDWLKEQGEWLLSNLGEDVDPMVEWIDGFRLVHCGFAL